MNLLTRSQVEARIEKKLAAEYSEAEIKADEDVLKILGLIPRKMDYRKAIIALLKEQVAGFYDPNERKLHLATWIPLEHQETVLAHEICHAIQDQHFRIKRIIKSLKDNSDMQLARAALVEGDCTAVMIEYMLRGKGLDLSAVPTTLLESTGTRSTMKNSTIGTSPRYLRESLVFPYKVGLEFMKKLRSRHPWSVANQMYRRLPTSTEQMMHYDKYWSRERPVKVAARDLPALAGYGVLKADVLGEFQTYLYLSQGTTSAAAKRAAAGWGGDRLMAYRKAPSSLVLVHMTVWDSEADALEFANAQRHVWHRQGLSAVKPANRKLWVFQDTSRNQWSVQLAGRAALTIHNAPDALRASLQAEVWNHWKIAGKKAARMLTSR